MLILQYGYDILHYNQVEDSQMVMTKEEAEPLLRSYQSVFREIVSTAWKEYISIFSEDIRCDTDPRTRASFVFDRMVKHARRLFDGKKGVRIDNQGDIFLVVLYEKLAIRFKKLNKDKRSRNYPTQQTIDFYEQLGLPNMPTKATRLVVGYQLNNLETEIEAILIVCPNGSGNAWYIELGSASMADIVEMPKDQTERKAFVRARIKEQKAEGMNDKGH